MEKNTIWLFNIAMGNGPFIDVLPIKNGNFPWQTVSHNQMVIYKLNGRFFQQARLKLTGG